MKTLLTEMSEVLLCVDRSVVIHGTESWPVKEENLAKLERNDMMMVQWICNVTPKDRKSSEIVAGYRGRSRP